MEPEHALTLSHVQSCIHSHWQTQVTQRGPDGVGPGHLDSQDHPIKNGVFPSSHRYKKRVWSPFERCQSSLMAFNSTTTFSDAYALTDLDALNWFERQWVAWYLLIENPIIATGLMSFLMHEVSSNYLLSTRVYSKLGRVLWAVYTMDHHRRHTIFPAMEAAADKDPHGEGTMGVYEAGAVLPCYG